MMYTIITDSCCDLNPKVAGRYENLEIVPLSYTMSGETYANPLYDTETVKPYYNRLRAGEMSTTSQIPPAMWQEVFLAHVKKGEQILCMTFSSALSGTYSSACVAREMVLEEAPDAVIEVIDTLSASAGQGMMVCDALDNRNAGMSVQENAEWLRARVQNYVHWFTVDDLHFLKRGGRCSPSAAFFGSMLSIKPVLHVDSEGRLIARAKVRGRRQALKALAQKVGELDAAKDQTIFISHGDCEEDAEFVKQTLVEMYGCDSEKIVLSVVGPVIGSHSGPGTVALFFRGRDRG
ncbi:MAG: DegV family protein [Clostridiales bacterium]|nr:DegV family protein [Clostridiales bacterium]